MSDRLLIISRVLGSIGMVAILSTILTYALTRQMGWMVYGKLGFGAVALMLYFAANTASFGKVFGSRSTIYTTTSLITALAFLGLMIAANFFGSAYGRQIDMTKEKIFSLADQTEKVLERLDKPVEILAFYRPEEAERGAFETLIERYKKKSAQLTVTFINPEADPAAVRKYQITQAGMRLVIKCDKQEVKLRTATEEDITNAIVKVALRSQKRIYFLTGRNEADIYNQEAEGYLDAANAIRDEGYEVGTVSFFNSKDAPEDAGAIIVAGPKGPLFEAELNILQAWLARGGHVMFMIEPDEDAGLRALLTDWRIGIGDDIIVDQNPQARAFGFGPQMPVIQKLETHAINRGMKSPVIFPTVRSLELLHDVGAGNTVEVIKTSEGAWGETDLASAAAATKDPVDHPGPRTVMMASTRGADVLSRGVSNEARLLVVGDSQFANNKFLPLLGNRDLFLNAVNWLGQEEERISIRPRARGASRLLITEAEANFIKFFTIDIVPMTLLAMGVAIWQVRRRK